MLKKLTGSLIIFLIVNLSFQSEAQQKKGAYKPTKFDSVKKVVPPQYYGNAKEARRADSIAKAAAIQKERELKEKEEMERKLAEQQLLERKNKKKKTAPIVQEKKPAYKPTKNEPVKKLVPPQYYGNAKEARRADSIVKAAALEQERELKEKEEMERKLAEEQSLERKKKKKKTDPIVQEKKQTEQKAKEVVKEKKPASRIEKPRYIPEQKKVISKSTIVDVKKNYEKIKNGPWSLSDCIEYAKLHNLDVAESQLNERYAQLLYEESKNSRYPDLNGDIRLGRAFGRNIDPVTNQFVDNNFTYNTAGVQSQMVLFGWFQKKFQIDRNRLELDATKYKNQQIEEDISLNIATGFIRVLQARELMGMMEQMLKSRNKQLDNISKNNNVANNSKLAMISDIAADSATYIGAKANERLAVLQLKALMNFDFNEDFNIEVAENDASQIAQYFALPDVDDLFLRALQNKSLMQAQQLKLYAAKKSLDLAKTSQYPQLVMYGGLGTIFSTNIKNITSQTYIGESTKGFVNIEGSSYPVTGSNYNYTTQTRSLADQYGDHVRGNIGVGITVPMLNGYASRASIQRAKIALVGEQISMDREKLKLKQDIYEASEEVKAALQQYMAYQKANEKSQKLLDAVASKNSEDKIDRAELREAVRNQTSMQSKAIQAKYELFFKLKKLDYFVGNPIKM